MFPRNHKFCHSCCSPCPSQTNLKSHDGTKAADAAQKEALAALQAQVEQLEAQRGELRAHEAEIAQLRKTVGERDAEISAIQDGATAASSMASESVKESKKQVEELTRALAAKDERLAALEAGAGGAAAAIAELEAENAAVKGQLEAVKEEKAIEVKILEEKLKMLQRV